jgi:hypothetical protein
MRASHDHYPVPLPRRAVGVGATRRRQGPDRRVGNARAHTALGGAKAFPAEISIPGGMSRDSLRLGMSGSATAFAGNAGVIGLLASIVGEFLHGQSLAGRM